MNHLIASRRHILQGAIATGLALVTTHAKGAEAPVVKVGNSGLTQPPLPFEQDALDPVISEKTIGFHYGKHHKTYFDNLAKAITGKPMADASLEEIILQTAGDATQSTIFNNAAQAWNHNFYWKSLSPKTQTPSGALASAIVRDFGTLDELKKQLAAVCTGQFGSGWGWLVADGATLKVVNTSNAGTPFIHKLRPLLTIDVWEHAYYLDYQNRRADHVKAVLDNMLNWDFASTNFSAS